jgi:hypothetical protein
MRYQTLRRCLAYTLLAASIALAATASVKPQDRKAAATAIDVRQLAAKSDCPRPITVTLTAGSPYVLNSDFNQIQLGAPRAALNEQAMDKSFLYTFRWAKDGNCCEISRAVLTVRMKALSGGQSKTSADAGNDGIAIMHNGTAVQPYAEAVYSSWPFQAGQTAVKTWNLTGAALNYLNTNQTLSLYVQDDTSVQSATLEIYGCCLSGQRRDVAADSITVSPRN